jgi:hypothetical protein
MARRKMSNSKQSKSKRDKPLRQLTPKEMKDLGILTLEQIAPMAKKEGGIEHDQKPKEEMKSIDEYVWED